MKDEEKVLKMLQQEMDKKMEQMNTAPNPAIDNLSPNDMQLILYKTFEKESLIQFKKQIGNDVLDQIPFLSLMIDYLTVIQEAKELKLTAKGNLLRKVCHELYARGYIKEKDIETGFTKLNKEEDSVVLQNLKIIAELAGLTKKKHNKLSLTKKGTKLLLPEKKFNLFKEIFKTNYRRFNLGYHDRYTEKINLGNSFGYTLYLLLKYGKEEDMLSFYADKEMMAFSMYLEFFDGTWGKPEEQFFSCYAVRLFERFLSYYGFVKIDRDILFERSETKMEVTDLFREVFEIKKENYKFKFRRMKRRR